MQEHGHVHQHLVVHPVVGLRGLHRPFQPQHAPELESVHDIDVLVGGTHGEHGLPNPNAEAHIRRPGFRLPLLGHFLQFVPPKHRRGYRASVLLHRMFRGNHVVFVQFQAPLPKGRLHATAHQGLHLFFGSHTVAFHDDPTTVGAQSHTHRRGHRFPRLVAVRLGVDRGHQAPHRELPQGHQPGPLGHDGRDLDEVQIRNARGLKGVVERCQIVHALGMSRGQRHVFGQGDHVSSSSTTELPHHHQPFLIPEPGQIGKRHPQGAIRPPHGFPNRLKG